MTAVARKRDDRAVKRFWTKVEKTPDCWLWIGSRDQKDYGKFGIQFGYASSPLLHGDGLYLQVLHGMLTDDPQLPWMRVGTAPGGTSLTSMQDGVGEVTLVWTARNGDVTVQTVRDSKLRTVVQRTHVQGKEPYHPAVAKVGGHWFLGGARQGPAGMRLPYENDSPTLWELRDKAWVPLDDDLLRNQPALSQASDFQVLELDERKQVFGRDRMLARDCAATAEVDGAQELIRFRITHDDEQGYVLSLPGI